MKRIAATTILIAFLHPVWASPGHHPSGSNVTWGAVSNHQTIFGPVNNPAAGSAILGWRSGGFGMGILSSVGLGYEFGPVTDLLDNIDKVQTDLESIQSGNLDITTIDTTLTFANTFLKEAGDVGYANVSLALHAPFFPLVMTSKDWFGGSIVLDASLSVMPKLRVLDAPVEINPLIDPLTNADKMVSTRTSIYLKAAAVGEFDVGYSRPVMQNENGVLNAGITTKLYTVSLNKTLVALMQMDGASAVLEDQASDIVSKPIAFGFGLDVGALWVSKNYRTGAVLRNINAPSFKYNAIGTSCDDPTLTTAAAEGCYLAQSFGNEIDLVETYTMNPQLGLEGAIYTDSKNWVLATSLDAWSANNPVGDPYQWFTLSGGYAPTNMLIPGFRVGFRQNLAGSALSYGSVGVNWLMLSLDASAALESIDYNGSPIPRGAFINLGIDFVW